MSSKTAADVRIRKNHEIQHKKAETPVITVRAGH